MKIVFLVLASNTVVNEKDQLMQMRTWAERDSENIKIVWVRGGESTDFSLKSRQLYAPVQESYENILQKTVLATKWIAKNYDPDFLIRTNVSTYFDLRACEEFLGKAQEMQIDLLGYPEITKIRNKIFTPPFIFMSGTGIIMSRKAIGLLANIDWSVYEGLPDDVALSHYFKTLPIKNRYITRSNLGYTRIFIPNWFIRLKSSENSLLTQTRFKLVHHFYTNPSPYNFLIIQWNEILNLELKSVWHVLTMNYVSIRRWLTIKFRVSLK